MRWPVKRHTMIALAKPSIARVEPEADQRDRAGHARRPRSRSRPRAPCSPGSATTAAAHARPAGGDPWSDRPGARATTGGASGRDWLFTTVAPELLKYRPRAASARPRKGSTQACGLQRAQVARLSAERARALPDPTRLRSHADGVGFIIVRCRPAGGRPSPSANRAQTSRRVAAAGRGGLQPAAHPLRACDELIDLGQLAVGQSPQPRRGRVRRHRRRQQRRGCRRARSRPAWRRR